MAKAIRKNNRMARLRNRGARTTCPECCECPVVRRYDRCRQQNDECLVFPLWIWVCDNASCPAVPGQIPTVVTVNFPLIGFPGFDSGCYIRTDITKDVELLTDQDVFVGSSVNACTGATTCEQACPGDFPPCDAEYFVAEPCPGQNVPSLPEVWVPVAALNQCAQGCLLVSLQPPQVQGCYFVNTQSRRVTVPIDQPLPPNVVGSGYAIRCDGLCCECVPGCTSRVLEINVNCLTPGPLPPGLVCDPQVVGKCCCSSGRASLTLRGSFKRWNRNGSTDEVVLTVDWNERIEITASPNGTITTNPTHVTVRVRSPVDPSPGANYDIVLEAPVVEPCFGELGVWVHAVEVPVFSLYPNPGFLNLCPCGIDHTRDEITGNNPAVRRIDYAYWQTKNCAAWTAETNYAERRSANEAAAGTAPPTIFEFSGSTRLFYKYTGNCGGGCGSTTGSGGRPQNQVLLGTTPTKTGGCASCGQGATGSGGALI